MNLGRILNGKNTVLQSFYKPLSLLRPTWLPTGILTPHVKPFSCWSNPIRKTNVQSTLCLTPVNPLLVPNNGMKVRGNLQLRCKDCYFARKDGEYYVFCSSFPRHKQRALRKKLKYRMILTYAFQSKIRPY